MAIYLRVFIESPSDRLLNHPHGEKEEHYIVVMSLFAVGRAFESRCLGQRQQRPAIQTVIRHTLIHIFARFFFILARPFRRLFGAFKCFQFTSQFLIITTNEREENNANN